jgi:hypothetical protein
MEETTEDTKIQAIEVKTHCYSYKVEMVVSVLASNAEEAFGMLENQGGYVNKREVTLISDKEIYSQE